MLSDFKFIVKKKKKIFFQTFTQGINECGDWCHAHVFSWRTGHKSLISKTESLNLEAAFLYPLPEKSVKTFKQHRRL